MSISPFTIILMTTQNVLDNMVSVHHYKTNEMTIHFILHWLVCDNNLFSHEIVCNRLQTTDDIVTPQERDTGFMEALVASGMIRAAFVGHNHGEFFFLLHLLRFVGFVIILIFANAYDISVFR